MKAIELADGVFRLSVNIEGSDLFEGIWPIPDGVSLNAYIVRGDKIALIDLVRDWNDAAAKLQRQLASQSISITDIDYLILNHLEPDHTGWLREIRTLNPNMEIITTEKGVALVKTFFHIHDGLRAVKSGDTLPLGQGKELVFEEIPNVHWPETMATYEKSSQILFSCDAFGSYGSIGDAVFDDQLSQKEYEFLEEESLRYYANIVSSFSVFVERAIKKLANLPIRIIAPSHGIIWRGNPQIIIDRYVKYASYLNGPAEPEITLVWGSMYGNTRKVVNKVVEGIRSEGIPVHIYRVPNENISYILASAWKSTGIVLGMPTYEYKMFPPMAHVIDMFERKHVQNKKVFRFGSFGWSGGAQKECDAITQKLNWEFLEPVEWQGAPDDSVLDRAFAQAKALARSVKETCKR